LKLLTQKQSKDLDKISLDTFHIKGIDLMEKAGKSISELSTSYLCKMNNPSIAIVCGKGNNGGDGFASAIFLHSKKYKLKIFCVCSLDELSSDSRVFADQCLDKELIFNFHALL